MQSSGDGDESWLDMDDLTNPSMLEKQMRQATSSDVKSADFFFRDGYGKSFRGLWSGAAKSFLESAARRPTPRTLLNLAVAYMSMIAVEHGCENAALENPDLLARGFKYFEAGVALHKMLGPKSDLNDSGVIEFHEKVLHIQKRLLDLQRKCFDPRKTDRSGD